MFLQARDDGKTARTAVFQITLGKSQWLPDFGAIAKLPAASHIEQLKREIETLRHNPNDREIPSIEQEFGPENSRIAIEPALPKSLANDHDIVTASHAFRRLKHSSFDRAHPQYWKYSVGNYRARYALGPVPCGQIESGVLERAYPFEALGAAFVVPKLRCRNRNTFEVLRFEMLKE